MKMSNILIKSLDKTKKDVEFGMSRLIRAGYILKTSTGIYSFGHLGFLAIKKLSNLIEKELEKVGVLNCILPVIQEINLWNKTRPNKYGSETLTLNNKYVLAPSAEEVATLFIKYFVESYKNLPIIISQIGLKYRNEKKCNELLRSIEFLMQDAYSFDENKEKSILSYIKIHNAYINIFEKLELDIYLSASDGGEVGGEMCHEFLVESEQGTEKEIGKKAEKINNIENISTKKEKKLKLIEVAEIFNLGTKYSEPLNAWFLNKNSEKCYFYMGCYGIGVSRLLGILAEKKFFPSIISPYNYYLISDNLTLANLIYEKIDSVLWDDRDKNFNYKLEDSLLIGIPKRIIISKENIEYYEYDKKKNFKNIEDLLKYIK